MNTNKNVINSLTTMMEYGKAILKYLAKRPWLTWEQLFTSLELLYSEKATSRTNDQLIEEFIVELDNSVKSNTLKQYLIYVYRFAEYIGKPFVLVVPPDIATFVREETIKETKNGKDISNQVHDHIIDVLVNFFNFLMSNGCYSRLMGSPVQIRRLGIKRTDPKESVIFTAEEFQLLLSALPWFAIPAAVCLFILGVRPETLPRVSWEDFDWARKILKLKKLINKAGAAFPVLTDQVMTLLGPWQLCAGPVLVRADTVDIIRKTARELGIRSEWNNDPRHTAITMRGSLLYHLDPKTVDPMLNREFGNSQKVRENFYSCIREPEEVKAYYACSVSFDKVVVSAKEARAFRRSQIKSAVRVVMAKHEAKKVIGLRTPKAIKDNLRRKAELEAFQVLAPLSAFPSFVKVDPNSDLAERERKRKESAAQAGILEALNEIHGHEDKQLSIFDGRGDLFLQEGSISEGCPQNPTDNSSPKKP